MYANIYIYNIYICVYVAKCARSRTLVYVYGWKYVRKQGMSNGWQRSVIMLSSSARFICSWHKNVAYSPPQNSYRRCATRLARRKYFVMARFLREIRWNLRTTFEIHVSSYENARCVKMYCEIYKKT